MKYKPEDYAKALLAVLREKKIPEHKAVERFIALVRKNGDQRLFPKIIETVETLQTKEAGGTVVHLEFAREASTVLHHKLNTVFGEKDRVKTSYNQRLIAGARVVIDGEQEWDYSLERKLRKLFKNV